MFYECIVCTNTRNVSIYRMEFYIIVVIIIIINISHVRIWKLKQLMHGANMCAKSKYTEKFARSSSAAAAVVVCVCEYEFPYWSIICFLLLKCTYFMAQAYIFTSHVVSFFPQPFSLHTPIDIRTLFEKLSPHTHHYATSKPHTVGISKSNTIFSDYSVVATNDNCDGYVNIRVLTIFPSSWYLISGFSWDWAAAKVFPQQK